MGDHGEGIAGNWEPEGFVRSTRVEKVVVVAGVVVRCKKAPAPAYTTLGIGTRILVELDFAAECTNPACRPSGR